MRNFGGNSSKFLFHCVLRDLYGKTSVSFVFMLTFDLVPALEVEVSFPAGFVYESFGGK